MRYQHTHAALNRGWARWWRLAVVTISTLVLCSCRSTSRQCAPDLVAGDPGLPPTAMAQYAAGGCVACQGASAWSPPGIAGPWPAAEYLCDGGDQEAGVMVSPEWQVHGLDMEDTVAHYDALDGRTLVEPSNCVCLYAPRFGAVRTVTRPIQNEYVDALRGVHLPSKPNLHDEVQIPSTSLKQLPPGQHVAANLPSAYLAPLGEDVISATLTSLGFQDRFLPFENLSIIRDGILQQADKARLAVSVDAAITWTTDVGVQAVLDGRKARVATGDQRAQATFIVEDPTEPKLRLCKVASVQMAQPGETVDFTLRFDNVGTQPIGNIVLLDNLTTRLHYVPDSAQSSVETRFSTQPNEGGSLVLRWEIAKALGPGEGGIIRFRCRVR